MKLNLQDAATLLGVSPRTLRARLARGALPGRKVNGAWQVRRSDLPLTEAQRHQLRGQADGVRATVERAIERRVPGHTVEDLEPFSLGRALLAELSDGHPAHPLLYAALLDLAEARHTFHGPSKAERLRQSRGRISRAVGHLLLDSDERSRALGRRLEADVLSRLGGLIRWAEGLPTGKPA